MSVHWFATGQASQTRLRTTFHSAYSMLDLVSCHHSMLAAMPMSYDHPIGSTFT